MSTVSRRTVLRGALLGAAAGALPWGTGAAQALPDIGVTAFPFPLSAVRLLPGSFRVYSRVLTASEISNLFTTGT